MTATAAIEAATAKLVKPITCRRCTGKGYVASHVVYANAPGTCFACDGLGIVEGDRATKAAAKAAGEARREAGRLLYTGDVGYGDLTDAGWELRAEARKFRDAVTYGFNRLEEDDPARFRKAVASVLAGHPAVFAALAAYGAQEAGR